jgi:hypothetical protein
LGQPEQASFRQEEDQFPSEKVLGRPEKGRFPANYSVPTEEDRGKT